MLINTLYVTTQDEKKVTHNYRLPVTETVPQGHEIVNVRKAGTVTLAQLLSPQDYVIMVAMSSKGERGKRK